MTNQEELVKSPNTTFASSTTSGRDDNLSQASWGPDKFDQLCDEANALALYIAQHGDCLKDDDDGLYDGLLKSISEVQSSRSVDSWQALMQAYAKVTAITYRERGVNGRTILDTHRKSPEESTRWWTLPRRNRPMVIGILLFVLVMFLEVLMDWAARTSDPVTLSTFQGFFYGLVGTLSTFLVPAAWGGLGACVFLSKRISDKLFEMAFEISRMRGDLTRIFLGAILGVVVVVLFFPSFSEQLQIGGTDWAPGMAAFIAGLGVKPVYAAFESLSEELARRFKGSTEPNPK